MQNNEGLKFISAEIRNFKNIESRLIDINGSSLLVMGKNGAGKSSFIQALTAALDTKTIPSEPIREGMMEDETSSIEVVIGGMLNGIEKKYTLTLYFTSANKKGRLVVTNEQGEKIKTPATFIKSLIGNVSVDPTAWLNASKEKKLKEFKQIAGCEIEIDKINIEIGDKKAVKKAKKKDIEEMQNVLKHHGYSQEQIDLYSAEVDIQPIQDELKNISTALEKYSGVENKVKGFYSSIKEEEGKIGINNSTIEANNKKIEELQKANKELETKNVEHFEAIDKNKQNIKTGEEWLTAKKRPSVDEINTRLQQAGEHNMHAKKIVEYSEKQKIILRAKEDIDNIDKAVGELEAQKIDIISKSQLPVKGVNFTEDDILIDGLPMESGQLNTARLFDIAVDVAVAQKPNLRVIFLHEASLFDPENLKSIIQKIESKGYMAVAEIVTSDDLEIKFVEEELE